MNQSTDCPGPGRCHGCMAWCYCCDDVTTTCDAVDCDAHRCARCSVLLLTAEDLERERSDWAKWCLGCHRTSQHQFAEREMLRAAAAGNEGEAASWADIARGLA